MATSQCKLKFLDGQERALALKMSGLNPAEFDGNNKIEKFSRIFLAGLILAAICNVIGFLMSALYILQSPFIYKKWKKIPFI